MGVVAPAKPSIKGLRQEDPGAQGIEITLSNAAGLYFRRESYTKIQSTGRDSR